MRAKGYKLHSQVLPGDLVFIYGFFCEGYIKIGIARDWSERLMACQGGNPFPVRKFTAQTVPHELAGKAEHGAHLLLREHHHRGEWFSCSKRQAHTAIRSAIREARRGWVPATSNPAFDEEARRAFELADQYRVAAGFEPEFSRHAPDTQSAPTAKSA